MGTDAGGRRVGWRIHSRKPTRIACFTAGADTLAKHDRFGWSCRRDPGLRVRDSRRSPTQHPGSSMDSGRGWCCGAGGGCCLGVHLEPQGPIVCHDRHIGCGDPGDCVLEWDSVLVWEPRRARLLSETGRRAIDSRARKDSPALPSCGLVREPLWGVVPGGSSVAEGP